MKKLNTEQTMGLSLNPSPPADAVHSVFAFSASVIWKCVKVQLNATADCFSVNAILESHGIYSPYIVILWMENAGIWSSVVTQWDERM